jgi:hypothetical protein
MCLPRQMPAHPGVGRARQVEVGMVNQGDKAACRGPCRGIADPTHSGGVGQRAVCRFPVEPAPACKLSKETEAKPPGQHGRQPRQQHHFDQVSQFGPQPQQLRVPHLTTSHGADSPTRATGWDSPI